MRCFGGKQVVKKVQAYSEKRLQKANNPALEKGYYLGPSSERSQLYVPENICSRISDILLYMYV